MSASACRRPGDDALADGSLVQTYGAGGMKGLLFRPAEALLNALLERWIAESTAAEDRVRDLEGRSFSIGLEGLGVDWVLRAAGGRLVVSADTSSPPDAKITGTPLDLLRLLGPDMASRLTTSPARLTGSVHIAEAFADALRLARPDLEEELAGWVGDVAAHGIGRRGRSVAAWGTRAADALRLDASEYLQHEGRVLPSRYETDAFFDGVERLRDDVERAAARLERLEQLAAGLRAA